MNEIDEENINILNGELFSTSKAGANIAYGYLVDFARNLEFNNDLLLKQHELSKYCNFLTTILKKGIKIIENNSFENLNETKEKERYELCFRNFKIALDTLIYFNFKLKEINSNYNYRDNDINNFKKIYTNKYLWKIY